MGFQIKKAVRTGIIPLLGLYGKSGGGKTRTALLIARGMVGPKGKIRLIDSERGRGSIFADKIPGGYEVIEIEEPFAPSKFQEAIRFAEEDSDIIIVDSLSHCWSGPGGVLEMQEAELDRMAGDNWSKREQCKMAAWIKPKQELKSLVQNTILRSKVPMICCLRGEEKTRMLKEDGKTKVITDDWSTPIFDSRFLFELLICAEVYQQEGKGGYLHVTKITHEDIFACLPKDTEQASIKHGELISKWAIGGDQAAPTTPATTTPKPQSELNKLKGELWGLTSGVHQCKKGDSPEMMAHGRRLLEQHLVDEAFISDTENLDSLNEERIREVIAKIRERAVTQ